MSGKIGWIVTTVAEHFQVRDSSREHIQFYIERDMIDETVVI